MQGSGKSLDKKTIFIIYPDTRNYALDSDLKESAQKQPQTSTSKLICSSFINPWSDHDPTAQAATAQTQSSSL